MAHYAGVLKIKRLGNYEPDIRLKQANVHALMGDLQRAMAEYEEVVEDFPRSDHSAEAYYQMGLIEQRQRKDLEKAQELFEVARKERANSEAGIRAQERYKDLTMLKRYKRTADKGGKKSLAAMVDVAELYLLKLDEPDSALATYDRILEKADTTKYAPKALYAIGMIYADSLNDSDAAAGAFERLIDTFPVSPYAQEARKHIQRDTEDGAQARFLQAEAHRDDGPAEHYVNVLKELAADHPNSIYAPKALYGVAWTYENQLDGLDTARVYYELLVERYPFTEFAEVAQGKLKGGYLDPVHPEPESPEKTKGRAGGRAIPADGSRGAKGAERAALRSPIDTSRAVHAKPERGRADSVFAKEATPGPDSTQASNGEVAGAAAPPHVTDTTVPAGAAAERADSTVAQALTLGPDSAKAAAAVAGNGVSTAAERDSAQAVTLRPDLAEADSAGAENGAPSVAKRDSAQAARLNSAMTDGGQPAPDSTKAKSPEYRGGQGEEGGSDAAER